MIILIIHIIISYDQNISLIFMWMMDPMSGFDIRLVFTLVPRNSTLQYLRCVHFWNGFPCLTSLTLCIIIRNLNGNYFASRELVYNISKNANNYIFELILEYLIVKQIYCITKWEKMSFVAIFHARKQISK